MTIQNLSNTPFQTIVETFLSAFENYFVKMPTESSYYEQRWATAKVDFRYSYGVFDDNQLVAFIINAVDIRNGKKTAYNTGTGVIPSHRGQRLVQKIYDFAISDLVENGFQTTTLECITANEIAIKAYKRAGFEITRKYLCYKGDLNLKETSEAIQIEAKDFDWSLVPNSSLYSWDFQRETIQNGDYKYYLVYNKNQLESFFILHGTQPMLGQFDVLKPNHEAWKRLFGAIQKVSPFIKINNLNDKLQDKVAFINQLGLDNHINQYEMELALA